MSGQSLAILTGLPGREHADPGCWMMHDVHQELLLDEQLGPSHPATSFMEAQKQQSWWNRPDAQTPQHSIFTCCFTFPRTIAFPGSREFGGSLLLWRVFAWVWKPFSLSTASILYITKYAITLHRRLTQFHFRVYCKDKGLAQMWSWFGTVILLSPADDLYRKQTP